MSSTRTVYEVTHTTIYSGTEPVTVGHNQAWLCPRDLPWQKRLRHRLQITPEPSSRTERFDYFENIVSQFSFNQGYDELTVTSISLIEIMSHATLPMNYSPRWEEIRDRLRTDRCYPWLPALEYTFDSPRVRLSSALKDYGDPSFISGRMIFELLADLLSRIKDDFEFNATATTVSTPLEEVLRNRRGVCQDFAHLTIGVLRSWGLAARYVSGYLRTYPAPGQPRLQGADASHAWVSVYCGEELGWVDIDPTNNLFPNDEHITVAWGRDYGEVTPLRGVFIGGGAHRLRVGVDVEPIETIPC